MNEYRVVSNCTPSNFTKEIVELEKEGFSMCGNMNTVALSEEVVEYSILMCKIK